MDMKKCVINFTGKTAQTVVAAIIFVLTLIQTIVLFVHNEYSGTKCFSFIVLGFSVLLIIMFWSDLQSCFCISKKDKEQCPYINKADCPFGSKKECLYDNNNCCAFPKSSIRKWRRVLLLSIFVIAVVLYTIGLIMFDDNSCHCKTCPCLTTGFQIINPILLSLISASIMAFLIDIPGRMRENQEYFVNLLSSADYLKQLDELDLSKLRDRITWVQHLKFLPNMSNSMVDLDRKICAMFSQPYCKNYTQHVTLSKKGCDSGKVKKEVSIEYTAHNPYGANRPISVDIGLSNSLKLNCFSQSDNKSNDKDDVEKCVKNDANNSLVLKKFEIVFDDESEPIDILPLISKRVVHVPENGLGYNSNVYLVWRQPRNVDDCLSVSDLASAVKSNPQLGEQSDIDVSDRSNNHLNISINKKVKVKICYELLLLEDDIAFTKRLRYAVKDFTLDYRLADGMEDYVVSGQLLGTLLNQTDISTHLSSDKSKIHLRTVGWLLQQNGALVVHSRKVGNPHKN